MPFLLKSELKTVGQISLIDKIINQDNTIFDEICAESIALMTSYLSRRYDVENIFNKTGNDRNKNIVKRLKDIIIYEIYERYTKEQNEVAARRYNEAMKWLESINSGEFADGTLPELTADLTNDNLTEGDNRYGGNKKYESGY